MSSIFFYERDSSDEMDVFTATPGVVTLLFFLFDSFNSDLPEIKLFLTSLLKFVTHPFSSLRRISLPFSPFIFLGTFDPLGEDGHAPSVNPVSLLPFLLPYSRRSSGSVEVLQAEQVPPT